ncbi:IclR family transcriptional regulator [Amycolatopsis alkalitolerans]|uniref:IclR family transcriptional regulator n=1 Tax=Amycolatopsis alkalitolerans TaxID=2547244 RepID=A0A5C4LTW0_9PSEU|nr:IclR family transcriptional regulator [Amycolatopsis alkalitolerans]TNC22245.1 IclR family transcriptional regulator [Amycolatopsis alkalitolerans]
MTSVGALERGLKILDLLIEVESDPIRREEGLSIQQVALELEIHKSTASRLMQTLVTRGYAVANHGGRRGFRLGPAVEVSSGLNMNQRRLTDLAHPFLARLVDETGECAHAAVASGATALVIDDVETGQPLRVVSGTGRRVPLHCTSAGKCLMAFGLAAVPPELPRRTARTMTNPEILSLHLAEIRERGYALDDEENHTGVRCISVPVYNGAGGTPVGCIGIDGPSVRMVETEIEKLAHKVIEVATELSIKLGEDHVVPVG